MAPLAAGPRVLLKIAFGFMPFALAAVFWAGSALSNSKTTGQVAIHTVEEVGKIRATVSRHETEIAILKTNQEYIKGGVDDIKNYMRRMDQRETMRARESARH